VDSKGKTDDSIPNDSKQPVIQSALDFLMTAVFIRQGCSGMLELFHILQRFISYLCVTILSCILFRIH